MPIIIDPNTGKITNPCVVAGELRQAYHLIVSGGQEKVVRYRGPNGEREVQYSATNLAALQAYIDKMDGECAALTGINPNRRFAIRAGSLNRGGAQE